MFRPGRWYLWLRSLGRFLAHPLTRYALAWLVAVLVVGAVVAAGWNYFNWWDSAGNPMRRDGNSGHCSIDFSGQWMMGRMLVIGQADFLYERRHLREMLRDNYPASDQEKRAETENSDVERLMLWIMGHDEPEAERSVGGPLYPPIHAFLMYPLALLPPQSAYRTHQILDVGLALLAAWGVTLLSRGRLWLPVVLSLMALYPGFHGGHLLGQNSLLTLTVLVWGWVLLSRGRQGWGGLVWGLLAFKPVWALSFLLVLLLSRRWRGCAAMTACGLVQVALTVPMVGVQGWQDWLQIGKDAADLYKVDGNWVYLSRDLLGLPRRWMLDWDAPARERDTLEATAAGWSLLLGVFAVLVVVCAWKRRQVRAVEGAPAAFLLLGGWLCCYHFMYYDVLLTFLPVMLLFTASGWRLRRDRLAAVPLLWQAYLVRPWSSLPGRPGAGRFRLTTGEVALLWLPSPRRYGWIANPFPLLILVLLLGIEGPFQVIGPAVTGWLDELADRLGVRNPLAKCLTFSERDVPWNLLCLLLLWLWCGWRLFRPTPSPARSAGGGTETGVASLALRAGEDAKVNGQPVTPAPVP